MVSFFKSLLFIPLFIFPSTLVGFYSRTIPMDTGSKADSIVIDSLLGIISNFAGKDLEKAIQLNNTLIEFSKSKQNTWGIAKGLLKRGELYNLAGRDKEAYSSLQECIAYLNEHPNPSLLSGAYSLLGWHHQDKEQLALADSFYLKALRVAESINDSFKISYACNHLGLVNASTKNWKKAIEYHRQAILYSSTNHNNRSIGVKYYNLGSAFQKMGNTDSALFYYKIAEKYYEGENYYSGIAGIANNMGRHYQRTGWYDSAVFYLQKALKYDLIVGTRRYICMDYINLADVYLSMENYDLCIKMANKAIEDASEAGYLQQIYQGHNILHKAYREKGNYQQAYNHLATSKCLNDSIYRAQTADKITELETIYTLEKKEAENSFLKEQQLRSQLTIKTLWISGSTVIVLFIISMILLVKVRRKNKLNRLLNSRLQTNNDELTKINSTKDKFFSIISHDLKGPIGTTQTMVDLYISKDLDESDFERFNRFITAFSVQIKHTSNLLENLLTWSRMQFGQANYSPSSFNLQELVNENLALAMHQAKLKNIDIINCTHLEHMNVFADRNMIDVVIRNLISNAIKFTHQGGTISILGYPKEDTVSVSIKDSGIGMSKVQLEELFLLEKRLLSSGTSDEKGTGLGLLLCKEFTEANKGIISVESKSGEGSIFTIELPRRKN